MTRGKVSQFLNNFNLFTVMTINKNAKNGFITGCFQVLGATFATVVVIPLLTKGVNYVKDAVNNDEDDEEENDED